MYPSTAEVSSVAYVVVGLGVLALAVRARGALAAAAGVVLVAVGAGSALVVGYALARSAIVERLHAETNRALAVPAVRERLTQLGVLPRPMGVDEFTTFFHNEITSTVKLAKEINLVPTN